MCSLAWERREDCSVTCPGFLLPGQPNTWGHCPTEWWEVPQDLSSSEEIFLCILAPHQILIYLSTPLIPSSTHRIPLSGKRGIQRPILPLCFHISNYWEAEWSSHHPAGPDAKGHKISLNIGFQTSLLSIFLRQIIVLHMGSPLGHNMLVKLLTNIVILFAELLQLLVVALLWVSCQETESKGLGIFPFVQSPVFHVVMHGRYEYNWENVMRHRQ